jgi:hypothetical protein
MWRLTTTGQLKQFKRCNKFAGRFVLNWITVVSVLLSQKNFPDLTILSAGELVDNRESVFLISINYYFHTIIFYS